MVRFVPSPDYRLWGYHCGGFSRLRDEAKPDMFDPKRLAGLCKYATLREIWVGPP